MPSRATRESQHLAFYFVHLFSSSTYFSFTFLILPYPRVPNSIFFLCLNQTLAPFHAPAPLSPAAHPCITSSSSSHRWCMSNSSSSPCITKGMVGVEGVACPQGLLWVLVCWGGLWWQTCWVMALEVMGLGMAGLTFKPPTPPYPYPYPLSLILPPLPLAPSHDTVLYYFLSPLSPP